MLNWLFKEKEIELEIKIDQEFKDNLSTYVKKEESSVHLN